MPHRNPPSLLRTALLKAVGWLLGASLALSSSAGMAAGKRAVDRQQLAGFQPARSYVLRMPDAALRPGERLPLVLVLHGGGGDAEQVEAVTGFTEKAQRERFIVVYPEGTGRLAHRFLSWNAVHCCGRAMVSKSDDVGFIRALVQHLVQTQPVDERRIYATGMSNGGMMVHRLGIELSDRLAAIAPVAAAVFGDELRPAQPVSALMINGQLDNHVPVAGGLASGRFADAWDGVAVKPALAQADFWAAANGCKERPPAISQGVLQQWRYACPEGREVEQLVVGDNGHAWPGGKAGSRRGDPPSLSLNATDEIWRFFAAHARPQQP